MAKGIIGFLVAWAIASAILYVWRNKLTKQRDRNEVIKIALTGLLTAAVAFSVIAAIVAVF